MLEGQKSAPERTLKRFISSPEAYTGKFMISQRIDRYAGFTNFFTRRKADWKIHEPPFSRLQDPKGKKEITVGKMSHGRAELFLSIMAALPLRSLRNDDGVGFDSEGMYIRIGFGPGANFNEDDFACLMGQGARRAPQYWIAETAGRCPLAVVETDVIAPALRLIWEHTSAKDTLRAAHAKITTEELCRPGNAPLWFGPDDHVIEITTTESKKWQAVIGDDKYCMVRREGALGWRLVDSIPAGEFPMLNSTAVRLLAPEEASPVIAESRSLDNFDAVVGSSMERAMQGMMKISKRKRRGG